MLDNGNSESQEKQELITIDSIRNECLDSPGFVIFAGVISQERDSAGNNRIDWRYIRKSFSYEDVKKALGAFERSFFNDVQTEQVEWTKKKTRLEIAEYTS